MPWKVKMGVLFFSFSFSSIIFFTHSTRQRKLRDGRLFSFFILFPYPYKSSDAFSLTPHPLFPSFPFLFLLLLTRFPFSYFISLASVPCTSFHFLRSLYFLPFFHLPGFHFFFLRIFLYSFLLSLLSTPYSLFPISFPSPFHSLPLSFPGPSFLSFPFFLHFSFFSLLLSPLNCQDETVTRQLLKQSKNKKPGILHTASYS